MNASPIHILARVCMPSGPVVPREFGVKHALHLVSSLKDIYSSVVL